MAKSCITVCFTYSIRMAIFWTQIFHKCSDTFRVWWGIYISLCYKFPTESKSERILKIGSYLAKLWARVWCLVFLTHGVDPSWTQIRTRTLSQCTALSSNNSRNMPGISTYVLHTYCYLATEQSLCQRMLFLFSGLGVCSGVQCFIDVLMRFSQKPQLS